MDLNDLKPSERQLEILSPKTGLEIGIRVSLCSLEDEKLKKLKRKIRDEQIKLEQRGKSFKSEEVEENAKSLIFAAMSGWEWYGDVTLDGKKPEFNQKNVYYVLDEFYFFRKQIEEAFGDEASFFQS